MKRGALDSFVIYALAIWRLTQLLVHEDGPGAVFAKLRAWGGVKYDNTGEAYGDTLLGEILSCPYCCSIWVAGLLLFLPAWVMYILAGSALSLGFRKWMRS